ncbi:hypothetical protein Tco_0263564, partial [Tanacetum coccineum]
VNETDDADELDMDLTDDDPNGDNDVARYVVFMYNKSTETPKFTYFSLTITTSSIDFIQTLLDEIPINELMDFMSHLDYIDAQTTSVVHNPKGNLKVGSFLLGQSEVPYGTHVNVQATNIVLQEMFPNDANHITSPPATTTNKHLTNSQPSSLQAKAKKLMQKATQNMRKINLKKPATQKYQNQSGKSGKHG